MDVMLCFRRHKARQTLRMDSLKRVAKVSGILSERLIVLQNIITLIVNELNQLVNWLDCNVER